MRHAAGFCIAFLLSIVAAEGQEDFTPDPRFWRVTGVAADDVLHLRDVPSADSKSLANIPPNAHGLRNLGCRRNQPALVDWAHMNAQHRREALTEWCRVEYRGMQGWVAGRYLKKDSVRAH
jgi:hypothetical protein